MYNGLNLLIDDETRTYWDHITGEAVHGELKSQRLEQWGLEQSDVKTLEVNEPGLLLVQPRQQLSKRIINWVMNLSFLNGILPPGFRGTMGESDDRLPQMQMGLGVIGKSTQRFYPIGQLATPIEDRLDGIHLEIAIDPSSHVPSAVAPDGTRPTQLFCRWYGFSYTYPGCETFAAAEAASTAV